MEPRRHRAGEPVDDLCRACKALRRHTVMVADGEGRILRVVCDYCGSEHHYRGGGRVAIAGVSASERAPVARPSSIAPPPALVSDREIAEPHVMADSSEALEALLRRVIREETGLTPVALAEKWRGGDLVLKPGKPGVQDKTVPIETFFHKIVMLRNRLRTLEQQVNASDLPDDQKLKLQGYVTGCYGSLTSFNVLFADEADRFVGQASGD